MSVTTKRGGGGTEELDRRIQELELEARQASDGQDYARADRAKKKARELAARRDRIAERERRAEAKAAAKAARKRRGRPASVPDPTPEEEANFPDGVRFERADDATQRLVPYQALFVDGVMRLEPGRYSAAVAFDDISYVSIKEEEQAKIILGLRKWYNALDADSSLQVYLASTTIDHRDVMTSLALRPRRGDAVGNAYREEINAYVSSKLTASARSMRHDHAFVIGCSAPDHARAARLLAGMCDRCIRTLRGFGCSAHVMTGQERLDQICSVTHPDDERGKYRFSDLSMTPGATTRDLVAPWRCFRPRGGGFINPDSRLFVGNRWVKSYSVVADGYGNSMRDDWLSSVSSLPHDITVSLHVRPWDRQEAISAAENHYLDISGENDSYKKSRSRPERGFFVDDSNLPRRMKEAEEGAIKTRDDLVNQDQRMFALVAVFTVFARTEEELDEACADLEAVFQAQSKPGAESWSAVREQAYASTLPLGRCLVPYERNVTTNPLSALVPFMSFDISDPGGMLLGLNADTRNFIHYDRPGRQHANGFILGQPGKGKSVLAKLYQEQVRLCWPDDDQIIIDPEGEYRASVTALGGQVVNVSETSGDHFNPLDISPFYGSSDPSQRANPLPAKVSFIQSFLSVMARQISDVERNLIDSACALAYGRWMETHDDADIPTLGDVYDQLLAVGGQNEADAQHLALLIQRYVTGTINVFNHQTNVNLESHLIDFSIVDMSAELKPLAMMALLDWVWVRVTKNRAEGRRTWLWIDEMQLLLDDPESITQFDRFWSRGRKWDLLSTAITQNIDRVMEIRQTKYMLQNSLFLALTGQAPDTARKFGELLKLSDEQVQILSTADGGEGLYVIDHKVVHYDFKVSPEVCPETYRLLTTKPDDLKGDLPVASAPTATAPDPVAVDGPDGPEPSPAEPTEVLNRGETLAADPSGAEGKARDDGQGHANVGAPSVLPEDGGAPRPDATSGPAASRDAGEDGAPASTTARGAGAAEALPAMRATNARDVGGTPPSGPTEGSRPVDVDPVFRRISTLIAQKGSNAAGSRRARTSGAAGDGGDKVEGR